MFWNVRFAGGAAPAESGMPLQAGFDPHAFHRATKILERKVCGWRHARLESGMPSGAGFDSYAFREQVSSNSRTAGIRLRATPRPIRADA